MQLRQNALGYLRCQVWLARTSALIVLALLVACGKKDVGDPRESREPAHEVRDPAPPRQVAPEALAKLPRTPDGKPIINSTTIHGTQVALVYDQTLDTPVTRWGQCMSRVHACYRSNRGPIAGCVERIEVCADPRGGEQCCPRACIEEFRARLASLGDEDEAVNQSFLRGACIPRFLEEEKTEP